MVRLRPLLIRVERAVGDRDRAGARTIDPHSDADGEIAHAHRNQSAERRHMYVVERDISGVVTDVEAEAVVLNAHARLTERDIAVDVTVVRSVDGHDGMPNRQVVVGVADEPDRLALEAADEDCTHDGADNLDTRSEEHT